MLSENYMIELRKTLTDAIENLSEFPDLDDDKSPFTCDAIHAAALANLELGPYSHGGKRKFAFLERFGLPEKFNPFMTVFGFKNCSPEHQIARAIWLTLLLNATFDPDLQEYFVCEA